MTRFFKLLTILKLLALSAALTLLSCKAPTTEHRAQPQIHTWEMQEIVHLAD